MLLQYRQPPMSTRKGGDHNPDIGDILTPPKFSGPHSVASPLRMKQYRRWERTAQSELLSNIVPFGESPIVGLAFSFLNNGGGECGGGGGDDVILDSPPSSPVPLPLRHSQGQQPQRQRESGASFR